MSTPKGTPKTLNEAIWDGMVKVATVFPQGGAQLADSIEQSVLDYLRQKFGVTYIMMSELDGPVAMALLQELARQIGVERKKEK